MQYKMLYGRGPREQDKGARQGVRWEQDLSHSLSCPCLGFSVPTKMLQFKVPTTMRGSPCLTPCLGFSVPTKMLQFKVPTTMREHGVRGVRQGVRQGVWQGARQGVRQGARQGARQGEMGQDEFMLGFRVPTNILGFKVPTTMWQHGVRGARQVCCLSLSLPPHGGGDLKF